MQQSQYNKKFFFHKLLPLLQGNGGKYQHYANALGNQLKHKERQYIPTTELNKISIEVKVLRLELYWHCN